MNCDKNLNVVSFDIPYPANYGGVIDVYYRLKTLSENGINIHLHCFKYGRTETEQLNKICKKVYYYHRSKSIVNQLSLSPFIVVSRKNKKLFQNLLSNNYPILFEGIHCSYYLNHPKLENRRKIVRSHNVEHHYYKELSLKSTSILEKIYYRIEATKLKRFEKIYFHADYIASISQKDKKYFQEKYGKTFLLMPGHPNKEVSSLVGKGDFILFHGNLSVEENEEAVLFIVKEIAPKISFQFVVAGKEPSVFLKRAIKKTKNVRLIPNPENEEMRHLIRNAHINLIPTFQATGFKLKLMDSLFTGRFCLGTPQLVEGTDLDGLVNIARNENEFVEKIIKLVNTDFTNEMIQKRKEELEKYDNQIMITELVDKLYF